LSDKLVERLKSREQSVTTLTGDFENSSAPLLQDSGNLGESLATISTSLSESTPLLESSETGFEAYKHSMELELARAKAEALAWKVAAGAGGIVAIVALLWGATR
jgi:predicted trehalose synthase